MPLAARGRSRRRRACARSASSFWPSIFLVSAGLGAYHAGVEWGFWAGPNDCGGAPAPTAGRWAIFSPAPDDPRRQLHRGGLALSRIVARRMERRDLARPRRCRRDPRGAALSRLTAPARYPSRDSPASSRAGSSAGTAGRWVQVVHRRRVGFCSGHMSTSPRQAVALAQIAGRAGGDDVLPGRLAALRARHHVVEGQILARRRNTGR